MFSTFLCLFIFCGYYINNTFYLQYIYIKIKKSQSRISWKEIKSIIINWKRPSRRRVAFLDLITCQYSVVHRTRLPACPVQMPKEWRAGSSSWGPQRSAAWWSIPKSQGWRRRSPGSAGLRSSQGEGWWSEDLFASCFRSVFY